MKNFKISLLLASLTLAPSFALAENQGSSVDSKEISADGLSVETVQYSGGHVNSKRCWYTSGNWVGGEAWRHNVTCEWSGGGERTVISSAPIPTPTAE